MDLKYDYIDYDGRVLHSFVVKSNHTPYKKSTDSEYKYEPYYDKEELRKYVHKYLSKYCTSNESTEMDIWTKRLINIMAVIIVSLFIFYALIILHMSLYNMCTINIQIFKSADIRLIILHILFLFIEYFAILVLGWMCHVCYIEYKITKPLYIEKYVFYLTRIPIINIYGLFIYLILFIYGYVKIVIVPLFKNK